MSFLQIGIMWTNHHSLFRMVRRVDQRLLLLNLALLATVSFLPLPTRLLAEHTHGADARTAAVLYTGNLLVNAVCFNGLWRYLTHSGLLVEGLPRDLLRDIDVRYWLGLAGYAVAVLLSLVLPVAGILVTVVLALVFALGPSPRSANQGQA